MNEKDLHRNLQSVRDIRTLLLHCSPVTLNQQLKQSFQTFAALPVDDTRQQTSQTQAEVQDELSVGSDRSRVIAKELFKSIILTAVGLDDAVVDHWMQATRYGRTDFAGVCCTSDSLLSGAVTSIGGRAVQDIQSLEWIRAGTDKLKEDLLEKKPRVVWMTPPQGFIEYKMNILVVFLWPVEQDWVRDESVRGSYSARVPRSSLVRRVLVTHIMEEEGEDQENEKDDRREGGQQELEGRIAESQNNHIMSA